MAAFNIVQQDVVMISLSVNACVVVHFLLARAVDQIMAIAGSKQSPGGCLMAVHKRRPNRLAMVLSEQVTLWILVVLIFSALTYTTISSLPFSYQPSPYPNFLINFILCAGAARFLVAAGRIALVKEAVVHLSAIAARSAPTFGQSGHRSLDVIYNLLSSASSVVFLGYKQNLLFGVTASLMEVSSTPLEFCRMVKLSQRDSGSYKRLLLVSCITCVACRALLPLVILLLAIRQESPMIMDNVPMVTAITIGIYSLFYHSLIIFQSARRVFQLSATSSLPSYNYDSFTPFSVQDYPEALTGDFRPGTPEVLFESPEKSKQDHVKELNGGLFRSCDSPNIFYPLPGKMKDPLGESSKTKENSRYFLLHKMQTGIYTETTPSGSLDRTLDTHSSQIALLDNMMDNMTNDTARL